MTTAQQCDIVPCETHSVRRRLCVIMKHVALPISSSSSGSCGGSCIDHNVTRSSGTVRRQWRQDLAVKLHTHEKPPNLKETVARIVGSIRDIFIMLEPHAAEAAAVVDGVRALDDRSSGWAAGRTGRDESNEIRGTEMRHDRDQLEGLLRNGRVLPTAAHMVILLSEMSLNVLSASVMASLIIVTKMHRKFHLRLKPALLNLSIYLDSRLRVTDITKQEIHRHTINMLLLLRKQSPKSFFRLMALYLRLRHIAATPRNLAKRLVVAVVSIYFHTLILSLWFMEKTMPNVLRATQTPWEKLYKLADTVLH